MFRITSNGKPIQSVDGKVHEWDNYYEAAMQYDSIKGEGILIVCDDYTGMPPTLTAFLHHFPKGTKGIDHYRRWVTIKTNEFKELYSGSDFSVRFEGWLMRGIPEQQKLF